MTRQARWAYEAALAVLGPERVAPVPPSRWETAYWILVKLEEGAPSTAVEEQFAYYAVSWRTPDAQVMQVVTTWLASPEGQSREIDPWWTLRHETTSNAEFRHALGQAWLLVRGEALATWDRAPEAFEDMEEHTREQDSALVETLHVAYRTWLRWRVDYCSVAVRETPIPPVPSPSERWAEEIRTVLGSDDHEAC